VWWERSRRQAVNNRLLFTARAGGPQVPPPRNVSIQASSFLAANLSDERLCGEAPPPEEGALQPADRLFAAEHANVQMAFNVYQTAVEEGVRRVVVSSSNHAADFYEPLILKGARPSARARVRPRP
jgi:hypothetical protein